MYMPFMRPAFTERGRLLMKTGRIKSAAGGDIALSRIVLGVGNYGFGRNPSDKAFPLMDRYFEAGGRAMDTGRVYVAWVKGGASQSERNLGDWMRSRGVRGEMTVITKGGHPEWRAIHHSRLAPECIEYDIRTSLAVMDIEDIDIYFLHRDDEQIPVGEIMDALHEHVEEGLCKSVGASNWTIARILEANAYAAKHNKTPFTASQIQWTLADCHRYMLGDQTCLCMEPREYESYLAAEIPVLSYTSQARGFFTKYLEGGEAAVTRNGIPSLFLTDVNIERAKKVAEVCERLGCSPAALGAAYVTDNKLDGYAIVGCSNMEQLEDTLTANDLTLEQKTIDYLLS